MPRYMMNDGSWHESVKRLTRTEAERLVSGNSDAGNDTGDWVDWVDVFPPETPVLDAHALSVGLRELHDDTEEFLYRLEWQADRYCSLFDTAYNTTSLEAY